VRTVIRYRNGVLNGKGASLLDGYMEDLATDRIYRLMIAQRVLHQSQSARRRWPARRTFFSAGDRLFDEELAKLQKDLPAEIDRKAATTLPKPAASPRK